MAASADTDIAFWPTSIKIISMVICWIKKIIFEKTEVLFAMENNLYL
jgi:hypothetical protein